MAKTRQLTRKRLASKDAELSALLDEFDFDATDSEDDSVFDVEDDAEYEEDYRADMEELRGLTDDLSGTEKERQARDAFLRDQRRSPEALEDIDTIRKQQQQELADQIARQRGIAVNATRQATDAIRSQASAVAGRIGTLPTPGGLGLVIIVLATLLLIIIPVNGEPRLVWLWLVITGKAKLRTEDAAQQVATTSSSAEAILAAARTAANATLPGSGVLIPSSLPPIAPVLPSIIGQVAGDFGLDVTLPGLNRYIH